MRSIQYAYNCERVRYRTGVYKYREGVAREHLEVRDRLWRSLVLVRPSYDEGAESGHGNDTANGHQCENEALLSSKPGEQAF